LLENKQRFVETGTTLGDFRFQDGNLGVLAAQA